MKQAGTLLAACLVLVPAAVNGQTELCPEADSGQNSVEPAGLAEQWLPRIQRFASAIPTLSPREEKWLDQELSANDPGRVGRAMRSVEYSIREAKRDAGNLLSLQVLMGETVPPDGYHMSALQYWAFFASTLIDYDASLHLARLAENGLLESATLPGEWTYLVGRDFPLEDALRASRVSLARHVLTCIIPQAADE